MIIWGGYDGSAPYLNTGGRYNPSTDLWTATTTLNAPSARQEHTAVWSTTCNEMIIWGGYIGVNGFNSGGRYRPSTDSWTTTGTTGAPSARYGHATVWTGYQMIVWGGYDNIYTTTGGKYTP